MVREAAGPTFPEPSIARTLIVCGPSVEKVLEIPDEHPLKNASLSNRHSNEPDSFAPKKNDAVFSVVAEKFSVGPVTICGAMRSSKMAFGNRSSRENDPELTWQSCPLLVS